MTPPTTSVPPSSTPSTPTSATSANGNASTRARLASGLLAVGPHAGAHRVALRAGLSVAVPLLVLWATDHLEWSAYATFGAFASIYARNDPWRQRVRMQARAGAWLVLAVVLGTLVATSSERAWLAVPVAAVLAGGASLLSDHWGWRPPGPLFTVFGFGASSAIPADAGTVLAAVLVGISGALLALLVSALGGLAERGAVGDRPGGVRTAPPHVRPTDMTRHALRGAVAVLVAGALATGVGIGHPYWAMVSAVVPLMAREWLPALERGIHRVVGTFVGLGLAALVLTLDPPGLVVVLLVVVLQGAAELLVMRNYALALVVITPLALLMVHLASPEPMSSLLLDRGVETLLGVAVGLVVGWAAAQLLPRSKALA
ncbi:FUSC family protein [Nocardioides bruguierae]|uniref:FUSC family protein n=1 Tax=Nocardioides bruguierae TaxID=2945102 RepID=UPI002021C7F5|nr:FUSC family protein [Nocardioides bruguierae]MCL8026524.1 FUSC family protein [Nocardioides bruguierae]